MKNSVLFLILIIGLVGLGYVVETKFGTVTTFLSDYGILEFSTQPKDTTTEETSTDQSQTEQTDSMIPSTQIDPGVPPSASPISNNPIISPSENLGGNQYPSFIQNLINQGEVDRISEYDVNSVKYYLATDWEVVGVDGPSDLYNSSGVKIDSCGGNSSGSGSQSESCSMLQTETVIYTR